MASAPAEVIALLVDAARWIALTSLAAFFRIAVPVGKTRVAFDTAHTRSAKALATCGVTGFVVGAQGVASAFLAAVA